MTPAKDIQGNSWTDEPEIPSSRRKEKHEAQPDSAPPTKREGQGDVEAADEADDEKWASEVAEQRPPSDS